MAVKAHSWFWDRPTGDSRASKRHSAIWKALVRILIKEHRHSKGKIVASSEFLKCDYPVEVEFLKCDYPVEVQSILSQCVSECSI